MQVVSGPVRYFYLRKTRGQEQVPNWPPATKPLVGPNNQICGSVRFYSESGGWRAENGDSTPAAERNEPPLVLTRGTVLGLLEDGKRGRIDVELLAVRVVNLDAKGLEYATHLVVRALSGFGAQRHPVVAPVEAMVVSEYVEHGAHAVAQLDLQLTPGEYNQLPFFLPDDVILPNAMRAINETFQSTARFYSYSSEAKHGISLEVEAGRVSMHGRVDLNTAGEQARAALLATPGVVDVADHLLYLENLVTAVSNALEAKGLDDLTVLVEHALVTLRGEVPDTKTRYQAEDIARRVPGVRGVINDIVVRPAVEA
jgi:hypothetical protein